MSNSEPFTGISRDCEYCVYGFSSWHSRRTDSEPAYQYLKHHLPDETEGRRKSSFLFSRVFYTCGVNVYEPSPGWRLSNLLTRWAVQTDTPYPTGVFSTHVQQFARQPGDILCHGILTWIY
jgi:hypothetical protein